MLQRIAKDQRVTGDEHYGSHQQHPRARQQAAVSFHGSHPLAPMAEITRSMEPPQVQTAGR